MKNKTFLIILLILLFLTFGIYLIQKNKEQNYEIDCGKEKERVNRNPLIGSTDKKCCPDLVEWRISKSFSICLKPDIENIIIESPGENEIIKNPLRIIGKARGFWFFEGQFSAELYDENESFLGGTILKAKEDWMTENFVSFEGEINFSQPSTEKGKLRFLSDNPSNLPENQRIFEMPIRFVKTLTEKVILYYYNPERDRDDQGNTKCSVDGLVAIKREIPNSKTPIQDTIKLLLRGKENLEKEDIEQGITTEYPLEGFKLKSANLDKEGVLTLEFEDPLQKTIGGACRVNILWLQIENTAKQFSGVKKVKFLPEYLFQP